VKRRLLVVNADDFGQSPAINRGIVRAHEDGIVTSASLMVRQPAALEAARYAHASTRLSVGLHADLGGWACRDGEWSALYERVDLDDVPAVRAELEAQLELFRDLIGGNPTHIDSHQHVHRRRPTARPFKEVARRLGVPVRHFSAAVAYCGSFYGRTEDDQPYSRGISVDGLIATIRGLPEGTTELGCHPGDGERTDSYASERDAELATLCHPDVRRALDQAGVELRSFSELQGVA
jgi:predicted glycoside hydrolase/deacetylase ChbG (UPF0249 family)